MRSSTPSPLGCRRPGHRSRRGAPHSRQWSSWIQLENWKNFRWVDVPLQRRLFIIGPNASGKSNFLNAIRFLRDICDPEGGFQRAVKLHGGISQIRCLHARKQSKVDQTNEIKTTPADFRKPSLNRSARTRTFERSPQPSLRSATCMSSPS